LVGCEEEEKNYLKIGWVESDTGNYTYTLNPGENSISINKTYFNISEISFQVIKIDLDILEHVLGEYEKCSVCGNVCREDDMKHEKYNGYVCKDCIKNRKQELKDKLKSLEEK